MEEPESQGVDLLFKNLPAKKVIVAEEDQKPPAQKTVEAEPPLAAKGSSKSRLPGVIKSQSQNQDPAPAVKDSTVPTRTKKSVLPAGAQSK